ncbi:hypothetical protein [Spirosoma gilvum]
MEKLTYQYETKCRRCGTLREWVGIDRVQFTAVEAIRHFQDLVKHPRQYDCSTCKKRTVQDVVAYDEA